METPIRHIEWLAQWCEDAQALAVRISATVVSNWLTATDAADLNGLLEEVMSKIGELPAGAEDFLGNDLYQRVQQARGLAGDEDADAGDEDSEEDDADEESETEAESEFNRDMNRIVTGTADMTEASEDGDE